MSRRKKRIDDKQMEFNFTFGKKVDDFIRHKEQIQKAIDEGPRVPKKVENEFELSIVIAAGIKRAIDKSGLSREQIVDKINAYFGRTKEASHQDDPTCRNPLTINMFNNYLSKPATCPIPAYYLFAIHHVTKSLAPARAIVAAEDARIATGSEIRQMHLGKLEEHIVEIKKLKKEIKTRR